MLIAMQQAKQQNHFILYNKFTGTQFVLDTGSELQLNIQILKPLLIQICHRNQDSRTFPKRINSRIPLLKITQIQLINFIWAFSSTRDKDGATGDITGRAILILQFVRNPLLHEISH